MPPIKINKDLPAIARCTLLSSTAEGRLKVSVVKAGEFSSAAPAPLGPWLGCLPGCFSFSLGAQPLNSPPSLHQLLHTIPDRDAQNFNTERKESHATPKVDRSYLIGHSLHGSMVTITCAKWLPGKFAEPSFFKDPTSHPLSQLGWLETFSMSLDAWETQEVTPLLMSKSMDLRMPLG